MSIIVAANEYQTWKRNIYDSCQMVSSEIMKMIFNEHYFNIFLINNQYCFRWTSKGGSYSKKGSAVNALTLLAFLFFLNVLQVSTFFL